MEVNCWWNYFKNLVFCTGNNHQRSGYLLSSSFLQIFQRHASAIHRPANNGCHSLGRHTPGGYVEVPLEKLEWLLLWHGHQENRVRRARSEAGFLYCLLWGGQTNTNHYRVRFSEQGIVENIPDQRYPACGMGRCASAKKRSGGRGHELVCGRGS